ncbi:hypothetical protein D915_009368 [Fasciola hepatica]|uniref:Mff-like domain-containing protein n=1 Tax=Fasciola hepatica TaxID=6192 RepID=A0A4E0QYF9_FASHE|nr:hypothetical protein D915_009368 [Fasciola hepatica]
MQVPHRISFGPVDNLDQRLIFGSPELPNMKVPERIMVMGRGRDTDADDANDRDGDVDTGADSEGLNPATSSDGRSTYELNADEFEINPIPLRPSLEPPPNTLVLNEVSYPDVGRLRDQHNGTVAHQSPISRTLGGNRQFQETMDLCEDPMALKRYLSPAQANNSAHAVSTVEESKRLHLLEKRVSQLEKDHLSRQQLDKLGLVLTGIYFAYRVLHWVVTHL